MKITRVQAVQAHPVPSHAYAPRGPFPPEVQGFNPSSMSLSVDGADFFSAETYEEEANPAAQPEIVDDYQPEEDSGFSNFLPGATAQNNYRPEKAYRCRNCNSRVMESELDLHVCEE